MISRDAETAGRADLTVVVFLFTSRPHLIRCLEALHAQRTDAHVEILLPYDDTLDAPGDLQARFPGIRLLPLKGRRTPARLRSFAVHAGTAPVVAFLEDHCVPAGDWCARVLAMHEHGHAAIGGAVDKGFPPGRATDSALNWAVYLTDYSRYMQPIAAGPTNALTDCNVSYRRADLDAIEEHWADELHENIVNGLLAARGRTLWLDPGMLVHEQRDLDLGSALRDRFSFGRLFGTTRVADVPLAKRLAMAGAALLMPPVLIARVGSNLFGRRRHRAQFVRCLPALLFVTSAWMLGEAVGYLTGAPPVSLAPADVRPASQGLRLAADPAAGGNDNERAHNGNGQTHVENV
jgi:hypothetical protein